MNATVVHPRQTVVDIDVERWAADTYEIALRTSEGARETYLPKYCRAATTLEIATSLSEAGFVVTVNGYTVKTAHQDDTEATLYWLPNPIEATDAAQSVTPAVAVSTTCLSRADHRISSQDGHFSSSEPSKEVWTVSAGLMVRASSGSYSV